MSLTQFAMVEELASLVGENIPCKHLILSMEEMLVNFLQDSTSLNGVLELEPMNPYNRLLVHRLADIFGFSHKSVGEGEDRHLVLECCPETSIPSILVSDLLWQFGEGQSPVILDVFKQNAIRGRNENAKSEFLKGEVEYFSVRERSFSADGDDMKLVKNRPRSDPVVARRLIMQALGQTNKATNQQLSAGTKEYEQAEKEAEIQHVDETTSSGLEVKLSAEHPRSQTLSKVEKIKGFELSESMSNVSPRTEEFVPGKGGSAVEQQNSDIQKNYLRNDHVEAAKRMFANALGIHRRDANLSDTDETKKTNQQARKDKAGKLRLLTHIQTKTDFEIVQGALEHFTSTFNSAHDMTSES